MNLRGIIALVALASMSLSCYTEDLPDEKEEKSYRILKLSIFERGTYQKVYYRIFTIGDRSSWELEASDVGLEISETDHSRLEIKKRFDMHLDTFLWHKRKKVWRIETNWILHLVPCSRYKDTRKYVVEKSSSSSNALLGLAYSSEKEKQKYKIEHEQLAIPCLNN